MRILFLFLMISAFFISACSYIGGRRVSGNGSLSTQQRTVTDFNAVQVVGGMDVVLISGNYGVKVEADENLMEYIETDVDGDELVIRPRQGYNLRPRAGMKIYVTAPALEAVEIVGSGDVTSQGKLTGSKRLAAHVTGSGDVKLAVDAPEVEARTNGSGSIVLSGNTRNFKADINGSGDILCFDLLSETTEVDIAGSGNTQVYASKQLDVEIMGSGEVEYKGNASVNQSIKGSGSIRKVQ